MNDYLIDILKINNKDGIRTCLGLILSDKNIVKVFYAGQSDIQWIKRDFNLSIINFFDVRECANYIHKS